MTSSRLNKRNCSPNQRRARYGHLLTLHLLLLCAADWSPTAIAAALFCPRTGVARTISAYRRGRLDLKLAAERPTRPRRRAWRGPA